MDIRQFILPSGVGLTHIEVYTEAGPDGVIGGAPHIHMVCSEIYYVLEGKGQIELLSAEGLETVELLPNKAVSFRPGIFHRVLNPNRNLKLLDISQHGGLAERGDFVMSFPVEVLSSPAEYAKAVRVRTREEAIRRRDLAVKGYLPIREAFGRGKEEGREKLREFYRAARDLMAPKVDGFEWVLKVGAQNEVKDSLDACDFIRSGRTAYLERARHAAMYPLKDAAHPGMSGELRPYMLDETFLADGKKVA